MKALMTLLTLTTTATAYAPYLWIIAALALLLLEAALPGLFFFVSFALGAAAASTAAFLGATLSWQCAVGLATSIVSFIVIQRQLKRDGLSQSEVTNVGTMTGLFGTVTKDLPKDETGSVKVGGEIWSAKAHDGHPLTVGTRVQIIRIEGNKLIVKSVSPQEEE